MTADLMVVECKKSTASSGKVSTSAYCRYSLSGELRTFLI